MTGGTRDPTDLLDGRELVDAPDGTKLALYRVDGLKPSVVLRVIEFRQSCEMCCGANYQR